MNWCFRQDFRPQPPRSKRGALYVELQKHNGFEHEVTKETEGWAFAALSMLPQLPPVQNWQPRMDSHHQPSESESDVLLIELRGCIKWSRPRGGGTRMSLFTSQVHYCVRQTGAGIDQAAGVTLPANRVQSAVHYFNACGLCLNWSVRLDSNQHPRGYEPRALPLSYRPKGNGGASHRV